MPESSLSVTNNIPVSTASSHVSVAVPNTTVTGGPPPRRQPRYSAAVSGHPLSDHDRLEDQIFTGHLVEPGNPILVFVPGSSFTPLLRAAEEINLLLGQENSGMCLEN